MRDEYWLFSDIYYFAVGITDRGINKDINQDSIYLMLQEADNIGPTVLAVVCDGIGGLSKEKSQARNRLIYLLSGSRIVSKSIDHSSILQQSYYWHLHLFYYYC